MNGAALRHGIRDNEILDFELYIKEVNINHINRRATNGQTLAFNAHRTRDEEVQLHQLRLNRAQWLQATAHRFGRSDSSVCPPLQLSDEDTAHYFTACQAWREERDECSGPQQVTVAVLLEAPEAIIQFLRRTGKYSFPLHHWSGVSTNSRAHTYSKLRNAPILTLAIPKVVLFSVIEIQNNTRHRDQFLTHRDLKQIDHISAAYSKAIGVLCLLKRS